MAKQITTTISPFLNIGLYGIDVKDEVVSKTEAAFTDMATTKASLLNNYSSQLNSLATEVEQNTNYSAAYKVTTEGYKTNCQTYASETLINKTATENAYASASSYFSGLVIPTQLTYLPDEMDAKFQRTVEEFLGLWED